MDHLRGAIGANSLYSHPMDQEDRLQHEKTRNLMKRLSEIERRAAEMRKETERLRILKDEAKQKVIDNFPGILDSDLHRNVIPENNASNIRFTEDELEVSDTSFSSGDVTRSEGDETAFRFGERYNLNGNLPRNFHRMSKEAQEVFTKLVASNNLNTNWSDSSEVEGSKNLKKRIHHLKNPKVPWTEQVKPFQEDELGASPLGDMLKNFDQNNLLFPPTMDMNTVSRGNTSPINTGGLREDWAASNQQYFIPVDRQTYENWTQQFKEGAHQIDDVDKRQVLTPTNHVQNIARSRKQSGVYYQGAYGYVTEGQNRNVVVPKNETRVENGIKLNNASNVLDKSGRAKENNQSNKPSGKPKETKKVGNEEGEDTSHDAGDLNSQESTGHLIGSAKGKELTKLPFEKNEGLTHNHKDSSDTGDVVIKKQIGHPDHLLTSNNSNDETSDEEDEESEEESKSSEVDEKERDENFVIESDNVNDKLYSSESEEDDDPIQKNYQNRAVKNNVLRPAKAGNESQILNEKPDERIRGGKSSSNFSNDSTSTASDSHQDAGTSKNDSSGGQKSKPKAMFANKLGEKNKRNNPIALNLQSASESQNQDELDVSGPDNDLVEDDFWN